VVRAVTVLLLLLLTPLPTMPGPSPTPTPTATQHSTGYGRMVDGIFCTMTPGAPPTQTPYHTPAFTPGVTRKRYSGVQMTMTPSPSPVPAPVERAPFPAGKVAVWSGVLVLALAGGALTWRHLLAQHMLSRGLEDPEAAQRARLEKEARREKKRMLREAAKQQRIERRGMRQLGARLARDITEVLAGVGYRHDYRDPGQKRKKREKIRFSHMIFVGYEMILYRVGTIPWGCWRFELVNEQRQGEGPKMAEELALALDREVRIFHLEDCGIFIQVGLRRGVAGIAKFFPWRDVDGVEINAMEGNPLLETGAMQDPVHYPDTRLQFNLGMTQNGKILRVKLQDVINLLVCGVPGSGKSVFLNQVLCTWVLRNTPDTLDLRLVDLKGGLEFGFYEPLVGGLVREYVDRDVDVPPLMARLLKEMYDRHAMFKGKCRNITGWNERYWPKLPTIVLVIDELASIMYDSEMKEAVTTLLRKAVALGRATGIHLILCTQVLRVDVLDGMVMGNINARLAFNCAHHRESILVVGHGGARGMAPNGRGLWQNGADEAYVQAPFISDAQVKAVISEAAGAVYHTQGYITVPDILRHVRDNFGWEFPTVKKLWQSLKTEYGDRVPAWHKYNRTLKNAEYRPLEGGPSWALDDGPYRYRIEREGRGRVIALDDSFVSFHISENPPDGAGGEIDDLPKNGNNDAPEAVPDYNSLLARALARARSEHADDLAPVEFSEKEKKMLENHHVLMDLAEDIDD